MQSGHKPEADAKRTQNRGGPSGHEQRAQQRFGTKRVRQAVPSAQQRLVFGNSQFRKRIQVLKAGRLLTGINAAIDLLITSI